MSGLEQEYPDQVNGLNVDATTQESKRAIEGLGFQNHGLVVRSPQGEVLWSQPDHEVDMEDVHREVERLIKERGL